MLTSVNFVSEKDKAFVVSRELMIPTKGRYRLISLICSRRTSTPEKLVAVLVLNDETNNSLYLELSLFSEVMTKAIYEFTLVHGKVASKKRSITEVSDIKLFDCDIKELPFLDFETGSCYKNDLLIARAYVGADIECGTTCTGILATNCNGQLLYFNNPDVESLVKRGLFINLGLYDDSVYEKLGTMPLTGFDNADKGIVLNNWLP